MMEMVDHPLFPSIRLAIDQKLLFVGFHTTVLEEVQAYPSPIAFEPCPLHPWPCTVTSEGCGVLPQL